MNGRGNNLLYVSYLYHVEDHLLYSTAQHMPSIIQLFVRNFVRSLSVYFSISLLLYLFLSLLLLVVPELLAFQLYIRCEMCMWDIGVRVFVYVRVYLCIYMCM